MSRPRPFVLAPLVLALVAACAAPPRAPLVEPPPVERHLEHRDPTTRVLLHAWDVLEYADGRQVLHGVERRWYADGTPRSEAHFAHGAPTGELRRWYASGQLRSESSFGADEVPTPMRFWHENGRLSAEGRAVRGRREGLWSFWYEDGALRERGGYVDGQREGLWELYAPGGALEGRGTYEHGARVGAWQHEGAQRAPREE
ncbi:MAG: toxin-antitoxin system YwqK family antitoxin [Planctomycetes bacterium]|nr:toxin-antitoxin system YwqK family antitoxin [Planctomycetota bacterium]